MPLDMQKLAGAPGLRCVPQERWDIDGHEVALVSYRRKRARGPGNAYLACECDTDTKDVVVDGRVIGRTPRRDPHKCAAKSAVRELVTERARPSCIAVSTREGLEAAIVAVHVRTKAGEWLGQSQPGIIYAQEVALLLKEPLPAVLAAIESLYAKERIDLNGMILCDYVPGFRFPKEVRYMFRMMIESPLGWPNGDAGEIALAEMESAITKSSRFSRCADVFWDHNWPRVSPSHLLEFGLTFIGLALSRAKSEDAARHDLRFTNCERVAKSLHAHAADFSTLGKRHGFPKDIAAELREREAAKPPTKKTRRPRKAPKKR